jgi:hypothetical protein
LIEPFADEDDHNDSDYPRRRYEEFGDGVEDSRGYVI